MAVIGTFGSFTAARLGIYASQSSLNVTGNNIANINTKGYTRQRMDLVSIHSAGSARYANSYNLDIGYGVIAENVSQLRDPFMDIRYRDEQSLVGASETWLKNLQQLSHTLDEVGKGNDFGVIEKQLSEFTKQLQQLNGAVGTVEYDTTVRSTAEVLCNLFNSYSEALDTVENSQLKNLKDDVTKVNTILTRIRDLNVEIREAGIYHSNALELRDQRNVLIDELSYYMKIDVRYSMEQLDEFSSVEKLTITLANSGNPPVELINGIYGTQIDMPDKTAMRNPDYDRNYKPQDTQNLTPEDIKKMSKYVKEVKADGTYEYTDDEADAIEVNNALTGADNEGDNRLWMSLRPLQTEKGKIMKHLDGTDYETVLLGDNSIYGSLQSMREFLTEKGEFSSELDLQYDKDANSKRGVPYYKTALDHLAQQFARMFNQANQMDFDMVSKAYEVDAATGEFVGLPGLTDKDGNAVNSAYFDDIAKSAADGTLTEEEREEAYRMLEQLRQKGTLTEEYAYYNGGVMFSNSGDKDDPTGINAGNITIAKSWAVGEVRILNSKKPDMLIPDPNDPDSGNKVLSHTTANDNIAHMIDLMGLKIDYLPKDVDPDAAGTKRYFNGTFQEKLADMNVTLAVDEETTTTLYDSYTIKSLNLDNERQSVSGVDLNDEATNMMVFQKSYAAACQLMTTLDSMLDKLINGTIR